MATVAVAEPLAVAQSVLYRFLAEAFSSPSHGRLAALADMMGTVREACAEMYEAGEASVPFAVDELSAALAEARAGAIGDLQAEYTRLFVAGMPRTPARLVESVQREGVLVGEAAEDVSSMYLRFGLEVKDREPDHLTAELEFLAYLAGNPVEPGTKEAERYRRARGKFLLDHLLQWGPPLITTIGGSTTDRLIRAEADLLNWLMLAEKRVIPT